MLCTLCVCVTAIENSHPCSLAHTTRTSVGYMDRSERAVHYARTHASQFCVMISGCTSVCGKVPAVRYKKVVSAPLCSLKRIRSEKVFSQN